MDKKIVITINREYGSGGKLIAKGLSQRLDIPYYDEEIIKKSSEQSAVGEEYFRMNDEKAGKGINILNKIAKGVGATLGSPSIGSDIVEPDNLFKFQSEVIKELAEKESCIFIGRCSDFVLRSSKNVEFISLFIYADLDKKVARVMEVDGVDSKEAIRRVQKINKQRLDYYKYYTGAEWRDVDHYNLTINTTELTVEQGIDLIISYLKLRGYEV